jgi:hydrogenase small subunit
MHGVPRAIRHPRYRKIVLDLISLNCKKPRPPGYAAEEALEATIVAGGYILVYEGAVMTGWGGDALKIAGKKGTEQLKHAAKKAEAIVAVGSCAVDGGVVAAAPNPAGATGVSQYLASQGIERPVVNLPTCPVNPVWVVAVLVDVLMLGKLRTRWLGTKAIFGQRSTTAALGAGAENGEFVYQFGSKEEAMGYCLYAMGCKGPQTLTNCPVVRWNKKQSWCVESGAPCIGCGNFSWVDSGAPFNKRFRDLPVGGGVQPMAIGLAAAGAAAAGLVVHGISMKVAGRIGAPTEDAKEYDRKHPEKGGDQ